MKTLRDTDVNNCPAYAFDNMTNIKNLDTSFISINEVSFVNDKVAINYEIEYSEDGNDAYPLYLVFNSVDGYFLCADNKMKYLAFAPTEKNKCYRITKNSGMKSKKKLEQ